MVNLMMPIKPESNVWYRIQQVCVLNVIILKYDNWLSGYSMKISFLFGIGQYSTN